MCMFCTVLCACEVYSIWAFAIHNENSICFLTLKPRVFVGYLTLFFVHVHADTSVLDFQHSVHTYPVLLAKFLLPNRFLFSPLTTADQPLVLTSKRTNTDEIITVGEKIIHVPKIWAKYKLFGRQRFGVVYSLILLCRSGSVIFRQCRHGSREKHVFRGFFIVP